MLLIRKRPTEAARLANSAYAKPQLKITGSKIVRNDLVKCLECHGVPRIFIGKGYATGFYPKAKPYPHKENCSQKGKF